MGEAGSFSSFCSGRRLVPKRAYNAYKGVAAQMYQTNCSGVLDVTSGHQATAIVGSAFCGNGIYVNQGIQNDLASIETSVQTTIGGNVTKRVLFESVSGEIMLQNQCTMNVRVILYDIIARKNLDSQTALTWGAWAPNQAWVSGEQDEGAAATNSSVIGSTPFQSSLFTTYFKVLKATHQLMAPGQTHVHRLKFKPNKVLAGEEYNNSSANIKGFTIYTMMVISGVPCDNNAGTVSTSSGRIDYVTRKSYRFKTIATASNVLNAVNNLTTLSATAQNTMNVDTDATTTYGAI